MMVRTIPSAWVAYQQNPLNTLTIEHAGNEHSTNAPLLRRTQWFPDVYSPPFVSEQMRSINDFSAVAVKALPPPCVDFPKFIENFAGKGFLTPLPKIDPYVEESSNTGSETKMGKTGSLETGTKTSSPGPSGLSNKPSTDDFALGPENYGMHFSRLLEMEIAKEDKINKTYNLYSITVIPRDASQYLFQVSIPGIRENTPMVQLGDMIRLRQIRASPPGYPGVFTGYEYETYVYGMDKAVGYVVLRADGLWIEQGGKFNVIFGVQGSRWQGARCAVTDVGRTLRSPDIRISKEDINPSFLRRMLFPEKSDGRMQYELSRGIFERQWIDKELNYEQVSSCQWNVFRNGKDAMLKAVSPTAKSR
jgi:helicase MOV-10